MDILEIYEKQIRYVRERFRDIVADSNVLYSESGVPSKLRLDIADGSVVDVFYSVRGKYSYHWERRLINGTIYRHDNAPHAKWAGIHTFPKHFHDGSDDETKESSISDDPLIEIEEFLKFVREKIGGSGQGGLNVVDD